MQLIKRLTAVILCLILTASISAAAFAEEVPFPAETGAEPSAAEISAEPETEIYVNPPVEADTASTILGDMDSDLIVTIDDVFYLCLHYAGIIDLSEAAIKRSDANLDGEFSLVDASYIQAWLAGIDGEYYIGMDVDEAESRAGRDSILHSIENFDRAKGVDISEFNGDIDMNKIKDAGYSFVMIRLGYGDDDTYQDDELFESNVRKAEAAGLDWGAYIYSYALSVSEAKSEIRHTLRLLEGKKPTMPIAFDWEDDSYKRRMGMPSDTKVREICRTYLSGIRDAGYYPIIYTGYSWLKGALNHPDIIDTFDIWYAQWNTTCDYTDRPVGMWQYGGEVNFIETPYITGISGAIDKNYSYKNYPMIIKAYGYNNHKALLSGGVTASTSAVCISDEEISSEHLPASCNGVMGDSLRGK